MYVCAYLCNPLCLLLRKLLGKIYALYFLCNCFYNLLHAILIFQFSDSLTDDELEVVVKPMSNPFCSLLPARIPTGFAFRNFKRKNVVMSNDFICVVKSQSA